MPHNLLTNLIEHYRCEEAAGANFVGAYAGLTLTAVNAPGSIAGKSGKARSFDGANAVRSDDAAFSTGDIDFAISAWFLTSAQATATVQTIAGKRNSGSVREWQLYLRSNVDDLLEFVIYSGAGSAVGNVLSASAINYGQWNHVIAWHDATNNQVGLVLNGGTPQTAATSGAPADTAASFHLAAVNTTPSQFLTGGIDEVSFWKRLLTADEQVWLYNSGNGRAFSQYGGPSGYNPRHAFFPFVPGF